jgi:exopolyphosphatase/guanosine-5'-triphosphate,3'-diphosphate pyrophosphatase
MTAAAGANPNLHSTDVEYRREGPDEIEPSAMIEEDVSFPLRVACVDMGSNAIRFLAADFANEHGYEPLRSERVPVRLGHAVFLSGRLDQGAMDAALQALHRFREMMEELDVEHYRAVATSAVREAKNGEEFVGRVHDETGIVLEPISGSEEARLVHLAVANAVPLGRRRWLLADLGGGSVEVSLVDQYGTFWSESHTLGSVRLLEELTESASDPGRFRRLIEEYISVLRVPPAVAAGRVAGFIATGGNIETLAKLGSGRDQDGVSRLLTDKLRSVIERLAQMSYRERVQELGLREDRADVVLPAALVYARLADLCGVDEIVVPHVGVKDGVLLDVVNRLVRRRDHEDRQARDTVAGAVTVGRKYLFDEDHSKQVARLALELFDQLRSLHRLGAADRKILNAAGLLHDIGQFVSFKGHHKHSLYLISHTELPNFSHKEMKLVANVARYHRKAHPADHHPLYAELSETDRNRVLRLGALLRLADSLDRDHLQRIRSVQVRIDGDVVSLFLDGPGGLLLEGGLLKKKAQLFAKVFGKKVKLRFVEKKAHEKVP